jgi:hypothetical protein
MRRSLYLALTLLSVALIFSCQKEVSFEAGQVSKGSLQSASGDCLPKRVAGVYKAAQVLNDSNYIEVTINVTQTGSYNIYTDTTNGYSFRATGTFTATGLATVRLKGNGKPLAAGDDDFNVFYDASNCAVTVTVLDGGASSGGSALYTLQGSGSTCMNYSLGSGTYTVGTALTSANKVDIQVNVTTVGSWTISTATVDGFSYSGTGTFTTTGVQLITLLGSGTPSTAGAQTFTVTAGSASCTFPVTVTGGSSSACATPQGTYTAGTALASTNKISVTHTYAAAGTFNLSTNTVNGYSFGPGSTTATAGTPVTLTLNGTGTPTAAGTNTFTIDFGDGTNCTFTVTVVSGTPPVVNNDYFPLTANSWWSYDDGVDPTDTIKTTNKFASTFASNVYRAFETTDDIGPFDTSYYRKDAATGFYYNYVPTSTFDPTFPITFAQAGLDILFLKQTLTTGQTWNSDFNGTATGIPVVLRFNFTCVDANATITVNGQSFTNVYKITELPQLGVGGTFSDISTSVDFYYAKGIGLIRVDDQGSFQDIRHWVVF